MLRNDLTSEQQILLETIESVSFGRLEGVTVRLGVPTFTPGSRVVEEIKLGFEADTRRPRSAEETLAKDVEHLFRLLNQVDSGLVHLEIRHNRPFRVIFARTLASETF